MSETDASASAGDNTLTYNLTLTAAPSSPRIPVKVSRTATASQLREQIASATKIPLSSLKLIFRGRLISDDDSKEVAADYMLEDNCVIHCMGKPASGQPAAATPATTTTFPTTAGSSVSVAPVAAAATSAPTATGDSLQAALATLRSSNSSSVYLTAVQTLEKVLLNITSHPMEEKYRKVKKQNAAFQRRLGGLTGGDAAMKAVGFAIETVDGEECYMMVASADAWPKLVANKNAVTQAVAEAQRASATGSAPPAPAVPSMPGASIPGAGGIGAPGFGNMPPGMEGAVANMMSNPQALQGMLQNPMVRQMMERDPRFANNPALRQNLEALTSNPEQMAQISQMMQDPNIRRQAQAMMNSGQMPGGMGANPEQMAQFSQMMQNPNFQRQAQAMMNSGPMPGGTGGFGGATGGTTNNTGTTPAANTGSGQGGDSQTGRSDQEMTEEEMIAEAIARSMRET